MQATRQPPVGRTYRYYDLMIVAFATVLLCSNLIGAAKIVTVAGFTFGAGIFFFPISYIFNDVLTEVYGFARSRKAVWAGFGAMIFASAMAAVIVAMPPAAGWPNQGAYEVCYGQAPRIVAASLAAFCAGEFVNSFVMAKMKLWTEGKHLWSRIVGSTVAGEAIDSLLFYPLAFWGLWKPELVLTVMVTNYALKVLWEIVMAPLTYRVVAFLKRAENEDYFDRDTDFNPFSLAA